MEKYISNIKSKKEFLIRLNNIINLLIFKNNKTKSEQILLDTLFEVNNYIEKKIELPYDKKSYCNMLPYFEFNGGFQMMESEIGKETIEILYYFVDNY